MHKLARLKKKIGRNWSILHIFTVIIIQKFLSSGFI